jgi:hypothetical protein
MLQIMLLLLMMLQMGLVVLQVWWSRVMIVMIGGKGLHEMCRRWSKRSR